MASAFRKVWLVFTNTFYQSLIPQATLYQASGNSLKNILAN